MPTHDMFPQDKAAHLLGIEVVETAPGSSTLTMTVRNDMVNGLGVCHGGLLFTLADAAMAYASNASINNETQSLATSATIDFLAPAAVGQVLTATATHRGGAGRSKIHDVDVVAEDGTLVVSFRGRTLTVGTR